MQLTFSPLLNRYNMAILGGPMHFPAGKLCRVLIWFAIGVAATLWPALAQTVRVDVTPAHALAFDPDKELLS